MSPKSQEENVQRRKTTGLNSARNSVNTSLVAQTVKRLSTMRETQVRSLGWDPLQYHCLENPMDRGAW